MELNEEELIKKHKQEKKDLHSKIQSLKKSVAKGDKKKKKEVVEDITKLEQELECKQKAELAELKCRQEPSSVPAPMEQDGRGEEAVVRDIPTKDDDDDDEQIDEQPEPKMTRAQKRRNKKAQQEKEREQRIQDQAEKNKDGPRIMEMNAIRESLSKLGLDIVNIPADGNCLYCAINHQLDITGRESSNVMKLRKLTAEYMRKNKDDFIPFLYSDGILVEDYFENYCKEVEKTKLWGGQLELKALSSALRCPIKVIQATGPPTLLGEGFQGPELVLTYHRHLYRLGEHYNSTKPGECDDGDD